MAEDAGLRDKLRKIEALFAGATTPGEMAAAGAAAERIRLQLKDAGMPRMCLASSGVATSLPTSRAMCTTRRTRSAFLGCPSSGYV